MPSPKNKAPRKRKAETLDNEASSMKWKRPRSSARISAAAIPQKQTDLPTPASTIDEENDDHSSVPGRDPDFGTSTSIKTFYEGKNSANGNYNWVETPPKQTSPKVVKTNNRVAIKLYKIKDFEQPTINGKTPLKIHMVELQSPILVAALKPILKDEGMFLEVTEPAKFSSPFKPLFFCYDKITTLQKETKRDGLLKDHLTLLVTLMEELFGGFMSHLKNLNASGLISYKLAWTYFPKGSMLFCASKDCERICRVVSTNYECPPQSTPRLAVSCEEIAFDGETFAWKPTTLHIPIFSGNQPVNELPNYPLSFHDDPESVKERLTIRAKKALEYQDLTYSEYSGIALMPTPCGMVKHNVTGRILIDYFGYKKYHEGMQRQGSGTGRGRGRRSGETNRVPGPNGAEQSNYVQSLEMEKQEENKDDMLARAEDLVFVSPFLLGFALKNKQWLHFYVDDIKPVVWNDEAYGHLVYPEEQKDLVLTFVDNHQRLKARVDDVIMGKGQGLILLLSGPPGTGKTLTAEAVADRTRRPLYYLQAEDLGTNAAQLGPKIKNVFEMATEWDAVILLDEADVFMAEREPSDIARNELVSSLCSHSNYRLTELLTAKVFLRELEYFKGIIFLTTNLYSTIDVAFRSRVNIHLVFQSLPFSSRLLLWEKFLSRLPPISEPSTNKRVGVKLASKDMKELAKWELNGREIKNAIKTVRTWCVIKEFKMNLSRLESGIKVTAPQARKMIDGDGGLVDEVD
ncbi:putative 26S proteasome regulatory subunit-like protein [Lachnellula suecica]|uniref:Putative 26S proteasome regulatory subunit-like protein n=1 Tax=Lachnellula suecica TaxID=602035 RepID=A0A8T9C043_9HELO|nr:putative 26S proteasome regulatory subunit-like protein [Lachnellula suecica]